MAPPGPAWDSHAGSAITHPTPMMDPKESVKNCAGVMVFWRAASMIPLGAKERPRQARGAAAALERDLAAFVFEHGRPGVEKQPPRDRVAADHHAARRREGEHVAREGSVLLVGHVGELIAAVQEPLSHEYRQRSRIRHGKILVDQADEGHQVEAGARSAPVRQGYHDDFG